MTADRGLRWRAAAVLTALTAPPLLALHVLALHVLALPVLLAPGTPAAVPAVAATLLAGTVLAGLIAACLAARAVLAGPGEAVPLTSRAAALREKSRGAAFLRQRDPDAAGRPRPRAPGGGLAAAGS
jgi:hypothetical protein